jgi:hypothetical protein
MKVLTLFLLAANLALGAWLLLEGPVDIVREPARAGLQIGADRLRVLSDADLARQRAQAERTAASAAAALAAANAAPIAAAASGAAVASVAPIDVPAAGCIEIGAFASEAAAARLRTRIATLGLGEHTTMAIATNVPGPFVRLRVSGIDAAGEGRIQHVLKDFPKQELAHCIEGGVGR